MTRRDLLKSLAVAAGSNALLASPWVSAAARAAGATGADASAAAGGTSSPRAAAGAPGASAATPPAPTGPFTLPALPYAFDALEPHLDAQTMQIHHDKHHAAYVANLNKAVGSLPDLARQPVEELVRSLATLPEAVRTAVRNHGGGHANHSLLWTSLSKSGGRAPSAELGRALDAKWGTFAGFQERFNAAAMSVFGSGWAWLSVGSGGELEIVTTPNQDSPLSAGGRPLLGIDVWEHAYYLKFQNRRAEYVAAFAAVVDWDVIAGRYNEARK
ncbi:MAG: superoxide dismutase [Candidatus Eisenbacteria bacterium]|nr:superoxide dismutase [Candidatus Eisenbacteria bacterium]